MGNLGLLSASALKQKTSSAQSPPAQPDDGTNPISPSRHTPGVGRAYRYMLSLHRDTAAAHRQRVISWVNSARCSLTADSPNKPLFSLCFLLLLFFLSFFSFWEGAVGEGSSNSIRIIPTPTPPIPSPIWNGKYTVYTNPCAKLSVWMPGKRTLLLSIGDSPSHTCS